jgi:hypothetical protein
VCPHRHSPSHHAIFLGLHGTHVTDHFSGLAELWRNKLLIEKSDSYWIHFLNLLFHE